MAYHTLMVNVALIVNTFGVSSLGEALAETFRFLWLWPRLETMSISFTLVSAGSHIHVYRKLTCAAWCAIETVIWYFLGVETRGRTLEELDEIFVAPNPVKASKRKIVLDSDADTI